MSALAALEREIVDCRRCPRLVEWREQVAREKRAAFRDGTTGAVRCPASATRPRACCCSASRPPRTARTAPAACSPATARATSCTPRCTAPGFANQPTAVRARRRARAARLLHHRGRALRAAGQQAAAVRARQLPRLARRASSRCCRACAWSSASASSPGTRAAPPRLAAEVRSRAPRLRARRRLFATLLGCFHPSQQNTFTGKLTPAMIEAVLRRAREIAGLP